MRVYLAGPISGYTEEEAYDWREEAKRVLEAHGATVYTPRRVDFMEVDGDRLIERDRQAGIEAALRDYAQVQSCDFLLVNLAYAQRISIGTMIELGWAAAFRKPALVILPSGALHDHSFVHFCASVVVPNLEAALSLIRVWQLESQNS